MTLMYIIIIIVLLVLAIWYVDQTSGGAMSDRDKIIEMLEAYEEQFGSRVIKHLEEHFDEQFSTIGKAVDYAIKRYDVSTLHQFLHLAAISQYVFLDKQRAKLLNESTYDRFTRSNVRDIARMIEKRCDKNAEDYANFILRAHRFIAFTDAALNMSVEQLTAKVKRKPDSPDLFCIDIVPYSVFTEEFCKCGANGKRSVDDILQDLYNFDPKEYSYSEMSKLYTLQQFADHLRRKLLGFDYLRDSDAERERKLREERDEWQRRAINMEREIEKIKSYNSQMKQEMVDHQILSVGVPSQ